MKIHRDEPRAESPRISLIVPFWGAQRALPLLASLGTQSIPRHQVEVILVGFHADDPSRLDRWGACDRVLALELPRSEIYHKGTLYNVGLSVARGDVVVLCAPDVLPRPTFLETVGSKLQHPAPMALLFSRVCDGGRDRYPFRGVRAPSRSPGGGGPTPVARRDLRSCLAARRRDLVLVRGADEAADYAGYIGGVYEIAVRLQNAGVAVHWEAEEILAHPWHPGHGGGSDYHGPRVRGTTTAPACLVASASGRILPWVEGPLAGRLTTPLTLDTLATLLPAASSRAPGAGLRSRPSLAYPSPRVERVSQHPSWSRSGFLVYPSEGGYSATPALALQLLRGEAGSTDPWPTETDPAVLLRRVEIAADARMRKLALAERTFLLGCLLIEALASLTDMTAQVTSILARRFLGAWRRRFTPNPARTPGLWRPEDPVPWYIRGPLRPAYCALRGPYRALRDRWRALGARSDEIRDEVRELREVAARLSAAAPLLARIDHPTPGALVLGTRLARTYLRFLQVLGAIPSALDLLICNHRDPDIEGRTLLELMEERPTPTLVEASLLARHAAYLGNGKGPDGVVLV